MSENMKAIKLIALAAMCMAGSYASAQDLIVKKDGSVIHAKVTKIGTAEVEYKKWSNQDGPQYSIAVADILAINYQNGDKETFENVSAREKSQTAKSEADGQQSIVQVKPEDLSPEAKAANDALIAKYNALVELDITKRQEGKIGDKICWASAIYGIKNNSLITNDDIEIGFVTGHLLQRKKTEPVEWQEGHGDLNQALLLRVRNKTKRTLYVDLGNSFFISMGQATCYYVPSSTTTTHGASSGGSVNLGAVTGALGIGGVAGTLANGINVGGGSTNSTTSTTYSQRVIAVPPMSSVNLPPQYFYGKEERTVTKGLCQNKYGEMYIAFPKDSEKGPMRFGDRYSYTADNSPLQFSCVIAYSTDETCLSTKSITSFLYLRELIGTVSGWDNSTIKIATENILHNRFRTEYRYPKEIGEFPRY